MAGKPRSSGVKPPIAKPEVISTPPKDADASADKAIALAARKVTAAGTAGKQVDNASFADTRQHVADLEETPGTAERFTNTKQNIALINDPQNGPRFTLTKKEASRADPAEALAAEPSTAEKATNARSEAKDGAEQKPIDPPTPTVAKTPQSKPKPSEAAADPGEPKAKVATPAARRPLGVPPAAKPPSKVPVDSSKTFVGPNGTYYDEAWRWMDWRGSKRSWNWPAALSFGHWFAYRRLYGHAAIVVLWLASLAAALVNNLHVALVAGLLILGSVLIGYYANRRYFLVFRRAVVHVTEKGEGSYDDLKHQLAKAGGVNPKAPLPMVVLTIVAIGAVLFSTYYWRGGFQINIWPF